MTSQSNSRMPSVSRTSLSVTGKLVPDGSGNVTSGAANDTSRIRKAMML